jgi:hypothetical protein
MLAVYIAVALPASIAVTLPASRFAESLLVLLAFCAAVAAK